MTKYPAKITSKGQVTIPKPVRDELGLAEGDYLVLEPQGEYLIGAKAEIASEDEFDRLADRIASRFKAKGITRSDVEDAIKWARRKS
jgi:AbrB family looped-hinge helix DNA binding protein